MKVFVTGGTGAIGRFAIPALRGAGHDIVALARTNEKRAWLERFGASGVDVSLFDAGALAEAMDGCDAVCNLATSIPPLNEAWKANAWAMNERIRSEGSTAVREAARRAGVQRLVQESITFTYTSNGDEWIDETFPIHPPEGYKAVSVAEANAEEVTADGGAGVVLRFGAFYGPDSAHTDATMRAARRHMGLAVGSGHDYMSSIHLDDAAHAVVAALGAPAGVYNVTDDEPVTKRSYADAIGAALGTRIWFLVPGRAAALGGKKTELLRRSQRVSNARFKSATGWTPKYPSAREGWRAIVAAHSEETPAHA